MTWRDRADVALRRAEPPDHAWFLFRMDDGAESCARCGKMRARDESKNKPCPGVTKVALRQTPRPPAFGRPGDRPESERD